LAEREASWEYAGVSDFLLVLLAVFFLVSAILVWLLGGDAEAKPEGALNPAESRSQSAPTEPGISHDHSTATPPLHATSHTEQEQQAVTPTHPGPVEKELVDIKLQPPSERPSPIAPSSEGLIQLTPQPPAALPQGMSPTRPTAKPNIAATFAPLIMQKEHDSKPKSEPEIAKPSIAATLPPGLTLMPSVAKDPPRPAPELSTAEQSRIIAHPDVNATLERSSNSPATPAHPTTLPPSDVGPTAAHPSASCEPALLSTSKRGTRLIGAEANEAEIIDFDPPLRPRPRTPSIWSNTIRRPATYFIASDGIEIIHLTPDIRAERIPVRAETVLLRKE
jgi:hypothetical protein